MKITFIGTGEAGDPRRRNTSILLEHEGRQHLLDCGFSSAAGYLARQSKTVLTTIWISHFHGDHFFGIPQLLVSFYMADRREPLTVMAGMDCRDTIIAALDLAYPGLPGKLGFELHFKVIKPGEPRHFQDLTWRSAAVDHSQPAFGVSLSAAKGTFYYSGDGKPTSEALKIMTGCDLVIHEAISLKPTKPTHASIEECFELARKLAIPALALVHLSKSTRQEIRQGKTMPGILSNTRLYFPEDDDTITI